MRSTWAGNVEKGEIKNKKLAESRCPESEGGTEVRKTEISMH